MLAINYLFKNLLWCKQSKVRDKVKAYMPSLVQRGRRDIATLIPDFGYRWRAGRSHHTEQIYSQDRDQVLNTEAVRWAPWRVSMRIMKNFYPHWSLNFCQSYQLPCAYF